ncbi:MAG: gliding motility-associated C-terminal domain-containing protein, partial [Flavobacteriales bacterium]
DICGIDSVYISNSSFGCADTGANSVTIYATDVNGNIDSCFATVIVIDTIKPTVICKDTTVYLDATGSVTIDTSFILQSVFDICGIDSVYLSTATFNCIDTGSNTVTIYAIDVSGNIDSCIANIDVFDTINPVVVCKNDIIYLNSSGNYSIDTSNVVVSIMDNCSVDTVYLSVYDFFCGDTGINLVTVYIEDINGNTASCQTTILVRDTITPIVACNNVTVYLNGVGIATIDTSLVLTSFTSNCTIDSVFLSDTLFTCADTGINSIWVFVQDINGNVDSCMATITVLDTVNPVIICQDTSVYLNAAGAVSIDSSYVLSSFTDNCIVTNVTLSNSNFSCADTGLNSILVIAYDPSGNLDSCRANLTVLDTISPTAICVNTTIFLDSSGRSSIAVGDIDGGSFDNCRVDTITINKTDFNCADIGNNTVTLTVTDHSGNTSTCIGTVTVIDDIAPVVSCPPSVIDTVLLNDCKFVVPDYSSILNASDNCTPADSLVYLQTPAPGTVIDFTNRLDDVSTLNVIINTQDEEINQSTCVFDLKIGCRLNASIPQIFSPNGDGLNDVLYVYGRNFLDFRFIVFNRWGEKVFETNNPNRGWDGTYRGKPALEGVYVYYFFSKTDQLGDIVRKGDVTLVR